MSSSSPADLAVTFRSVPRRLHEAQGDAPHEVIAGPSSELQGLLGEAARLVGTDEDAITIADGIADVPADAWDESVLKRLREIALDIGRLLRHIAALSEADG